MPVLVIPEISYRPTPVFCGIECLQQGESINFVTSQLNITQILDEPTENYGH